MRNQGTYRTVWLIGKLAIKFPRIKFDKYILLRYFTGYLCNTSEYDTYKEYKLEQGYYKMCPVVSHIFGFVLIMKKATPISDSQFSKLSPKSGFQSILKDPLGRKIWDYKKENFGMLDNNIVIVDYADDFRGKFRVNNIFYFK